MLIRFSLLCSLVGFSFFSSIWGRPSANQGHISINPNSIFYSHSDTTYRIIPSIDNTYGYEILIKGKALIRQKNIPGLPGLAGFKRKEDAEKAARLVLKKLAAGMMPPSIDRHELDSMKVKY